MDMRFNHVAGRVAELVLRVVVAAVDSTPVLKAVLGTLLRSSLVSLVRVIT